MQWDWPVVDGSGLMPVSQTVIWGQPVTIDVLRTVAVEEMVAACPSGIVAGNGGGVTIAGFHTTEADMRYTAQLSCFAVAHPHVYRHFTVCVE
jgi:hypothetical protein